MTNYFVAISKYDRIYLCRFMVAPLVSLRRRSGPASQTYYPEVTPSNTRVEDSRIFREELSCAFSTTFLLSPHAVVNSYYDQRSIWDYKDPLADQKYANLYPAGVTPHMDLRLSLRTVYQARLLYQQQNSLRP